MFLYHRDEAMIFSRNTNCLLKTQQLFNLHIPLLFEGVCSTTDILAPGASEVGSGAAALAQLCRDGRDPHID